MKYSKPLIAGTILSLVIGFFYIQAVNTPVEEALAAPSTEVTYQKNLIPLTDSAYTLGTTSKAWLNVYTDELCLAGDCQTTWGGGSSLHTDATTYIYPTGGKYHSAPYYVATSTVTASTFPYASSTAITTSGNAYFGGNIGIGTTTPSRLLTVAGDAIMANLTATGTLTVSGTGTSTFAGGIQMAHPYFLMTHGITGDASDGLYITANNGTAVANFGVGNSANSIFNGGVNVTGLTTLGYASTTAISGTNLNFTNATGTTLRGFGLFDCDSASSAVSWDVTAGKFGCNTITATGDGVSNWLFNGTTLTPSTTPVGIVITGTSTMATTTINGLPLSGPSSNVLVGTVPTVSSGTNNTLLGDNASQFLTTGSQNISIGSLSVGGASGASTGMTGNTGVGFNSMTAVTGNYNTALGYSSANGNTSGTLNTAIGNDSLITNTTGSRNVALGNSAGKYETASDAFYVNNLDRTNLAGDKSSSLLYGTFNATPASQTLNINASTTVFSLFNKGFFRDSTGSVGAQGEVLLSTVTGTDWVATSTLFSSLGTVTSVDMSVPTGLTISGNPVTTSGTLAVALGAGYEIPTTTRLVQHDTAYSWGNHAVAGYDQVTTAGDGLTRTVNDFDCDTASGTVFGCLSSANWTTFNNKQDTITAGDALTLTGTDIDFDGGATPSGDLGGTWASPSVTDDSHAHTGTTLSGIDISSDTNLTADGTEIILTDDALSLGTALTFTTGTSTTSFFTGILTATNAFVNTLLTALNVTVTGVLDVSAGIFKLTNGANPTVDSAGETALNTSTMSLSIATSTSAIELPIYPPVRFAFNASSTGTSTLASLTTTPNFNEVFTTGVCYLNGTGKFIVGNGVASSSITTLSAGTTTVTINQRFNKGGERIIFAVGTSPDATQGNCSIEHYFTR